MPVQEFKFYLKPEVTFKIISTKWGVFTFIGGFVYLYHLFFTIAGVNNYTDITRTMDCNANVKQSAELNTAIMDVPIAVVTIFHMLEWIRWLLFLTAALVNVDLIRPYYALSCLNIPFGIIALLIGIIGRFGTEASQCSDTAQVERGRFLLLQIIALVLHFPLCMLHVIFFKFKGTEWCHEWYLKEEEDEDDD